MVRLTFLTLLYWLSSCPNSPFAYDKLKTVYEWRHIEFDFRSEEERENAIKNGTFNEGQVQPVDVQAYRASNSSKETVFISCPRIYNKNGIPATFGTISGKKREGNPIITPYPNWEWHTDPEMCKRNRLVSVYRVTIDNFDRLWIVDSGKFRATQICPPQILAFNLETNTLVRQYEIPFDQCQNTSDFSLIVADTSSWEDTFLYIADVDGFALLVYDYKNNKSWAIMDETFNPVKNQTTFDIDDTKFSFMDGILGLALSPFSDGLNRKLYYHAMASVTENWVYTKDLKNESLVSGSNKAPQVFHTFPGTRGDQSSAEAMDLKGRLFFGLLHSISLAAWDRKKPYNKSNFQIIGNNKETMQFPSGIKVTKDETGEEYLWVFCTRFQIVLADQKLNASQINFRIFSAKIAELLSDDENN